MRAGPRPSAAPKASDARARIILVAEIAAAAVVCLVGIGSASLGVDEAVTVEVAAGPWHQFVDRIVSRQSNMIPHYLLIRAWDGLGNSEGLLRLPSALMAVATVPVVYLLGRRLWDVKVALIAPLVLLTSTVFVGQAQALRGYSMAMLAASLSTYAFVVAVEQPSAGRWAAYAVLAPLTVYAHHYGLFVLAGHGVSLMLLPRGRVPWRYALASGAVSALALAPLIRYSSSNRREGITWIRSPTIESFLGNVEAVLGGGPPVRALLIGGLALVALGGGLMTWRRHGPHADAWRVALLMAWLTVPLAAGLAISLVAPVLVPRYLVVSLPAGALLAARTLSRWPIPAAAVTVVVVAGLGLVRVADSTGVAPDEDWRAATADVVAQAGPGDEVVTAPAVHAFAIEYYLDRSPSGSALRVLSGFGPPVPDLEPISAREDLWLAVRTTGRSSDEVESVVDDVVHEAGGGESPLVTAEPAGRYPGVQLFRLSRS